MVRRLLVIGVATILSALGASPAWAVSGAGYTTVNAAADGPNHCKNGNPGVNCNIYDAKEHVWLNGGPAANGLGPDGEYFFAVLAPGGQPNPNDGGPKNLSDDFDAVGNRTFTVTNGEVSAYAGTHDSAIPLIRLFPYADTTNPGGVYIMAICSLEAGYPVDPRDCKYDAFKVKQGVARINRVLSGTKYFDENKNGQRDSGESGLGGWVITIVGSNGTNTTVTTNGSGDWSFTTGGIAPAPGTTTYTVSEVQQSGWVQTGNTVDQSIAAGGATVSLASFVYTVTMPNNAISAVEELHFGNFRDRPPVCPPPTFGTNANGVPFVQVAVQDIDSGLAAINVTFANNITVDVAGFFFGTTMPVTVTGTAIDPALNIGLTFEAVDLSGNVTICDPVLDVLERQTGAPVTNTYGGLIQAESWVTIANGSPGIGSATINVNGTLFHVGGLAAGESRTINVASAMLPGNANVISVTIYGKPGATATVMINN